MLKKLSAFYAAPTERNRSVLQAHFNKFPMSLCFLTPEDIRILKTNYGFSI